MAKALFKGLGFRKKLTDRELFNKEQVKGEFNFSIYDDEANRYYYKVRRIARRPDVRVVACFYFPDTRSQKELYLPISYFPPAPEEKYWAIVGFSGSTQDRRLRGYLPIQELVRQKIASKYAAVSSSDMSGRNKPEMTMEEIQPGTQIGPLKTDIAWDVLEVVNSIHLRESPQSINPEAMQLLKGSTAYLPGLATQRDIGDDTDDSEDSDIDVKAIKAKMFPQDDENDDYSDDENKNAGALISVKNSSNNEKSIAGEEDELNSYPTPEEDESSTAAGKDRAKWKVGERLDVKDDGVWYASTIKAVNEDNNMIFVGYDGYSTRFDSWIQRDSYTLAPLHKFSETSAEREERLQFLNQNQRNWQGGASDGLGAENFYNMAKKSKAMGQLNAQLEASLADAKAKIQQIKNEYEMKSKNLNAHHPNVAKRMSAQRTKGNRRLRRGLSVNEMHSQEQDDEKLFDSMQYVMIIEALKAEVVRLQDDSQRFNAAQEMATRMIRETLEQAHTRRTKKIARGSKQNLGLDDGIFDSEKNTNLLYMVKAMQDDYKRQVLESEFRENQLQEYKEHAARINTDAGKITSKLAQFRARKAAALNALSNAGNEEIIDDDPNDPLMQRIQQLQQEDQREMEKIESHINKYQRSTNKKATGDDDDDDYDDDMESVLIDDDPNNDTNQSSNNNNVVNEQVHQQYQAIIETLRHELRSMSQRNRQLDRLLHGRRRSGDFLLINNNGQKNLDSDNITLNDIDDFLTSSDAAVAFYSKFLKKQKSREEYAPLQLWKAIRDYEDLWDITDPNYKTSQVIQQPTALNLFKTFIEPDGKYSTNYSPENVEKIRQAVTNQQATEHLFREIKSESLQKLIDNFCDFMKTPAYEEIRRNNDALTEAPSNYSRDIEKFLDEYRTLSKKKSKITLFQFIKQKTKNEKEIDLLLQRLSGERSMLLHQLTQLRQKAFLNRRRKSFDEDNNKFNKQNNNKQIITKHVSIANKKGFINAANSTLGEVDQMRNTMNDMRDEVSQSNDDMQKYFGSLSRAMLSVNALVNTAQSNYKNEVAKRIKLFDQLQALKGNIRVYCRVRPILPKELEKGYKNCIEYLGATQLMVMKNEKAGAKYLSSQKKTGKTFTFDRVFGPNVDQTRIYADVKGLVGSVLDGYNVCIFAYGQTGAGKTYTMEGPPESRGISMRCVKTLFKGIDALSPQYKFQVHVSMLEVYNECLTDLLDDGPGLEARFDYKNNEDESQKLEIRSNERGIYVTNTTHVQVESLRDVMAVVAAGMRNRTTHATNANEHSSRSHAITLLTVDGIDQVTMNRTYGKLYIVDLAGSERTKETGSSGQRALEANYINKSLSALGDVMTALAEKTDGKSDKHIPYRNSKLTYLLQDALGGNSKTMMFVNISPCEVHVSETQHSLLFAKRVRKVRLDSHATTQNASLQRYKIKLQEMKDQARVTTERLKNSLKKMQNSVKERDEVIRQLTAKLKSGRRRQHDMNRQASGIQLVEDNSWVPRQSNTKNMRRGVSRKISTKPIEEEQGGQDYFQ